MQISDIKLEDYNYDLPKDRIAEYPAEKRDHSKLLVYSKGTINHKHFYDLPDLLPKGCTLFFNDTKVIPARIEFYKTTGARIEIFLTEPMGELREISKVMLEKGQVIWKCMIGNLKKWKEEPLFSEVSIDGIAVKVKADLKDRAKQEVIISWDAEQFSFSEVLEALGKTPLPPYIHRAAEEEDRKTYQTVYSKNDGAVAAPTAGLHFTEEVIQNLKDKNTTISELTLHVSAGTFQPISTNEVTEHPMHSERVIISRKNLKDILTGEKLLVAVGTTSVRTLESTYWYGVKLLNDPGAEFFIEKLYPYQETQKNVSVEDSIKAVLKKMDELEVDSIHGVTEIFLMPGYTFRIVKALVTNFHLPGSTLILLIASFIGEDWEKVYEEALNSDYRFLSYGDSSLLIPKNNSSLI
ncbi:MAG: S-adenosylmethionine:tRNA ribosyltransferase-isomerase [Bacteroidota bacterium]